MARTTEKDILEAIEDAKKGVLVPTPNSVLEKFDEAQLEEAMGDFVEEQVSRDCYNGSTAKRLLTNSAVREFIMTMSEVTRVEFLAGSTIFAIAFEFAEYLVEREKLNDILG